MSHWPVLGSNVASASVGWVSRELARRVRRALVDEESNVVDHTARKRLVDAGGETGGRVQLLRPRVLGVHDEGERVRGLGVPGPNGIDETDHVRRNQIIVAADRDDLVLPAATAK